MALYLMGHLEFGVTCNSLENLETAIVVVCCRYEYGGCLYLVRVKLSHLYDMDVHVPATDRSRSFFVAR